MKNLISDSIIEASAGSKVDDPVIEIKNLKKSFGTQDVLTNVSLKLLPGENLVVLGKSGSGKSVLIKCIVRLLNPDGGTIDVLGTEVNSLNKKQLGELRQKIGFLFQSGALYDSMSVRQNLEFPLRRIKKHMTKKEVNDKIHEALENVGLEIWTENPWYPQKIPIGRNCRTLTERSRNLG